MEEAIQLVMNYYKISRKEAVEFYWDEVEAYMMIMHSMKHCK